MTMIARWVLALASVSGVLAVILGAFGAHALKGSLSPGLLATWHTGVQYHFVHTLALLAVGVVLAQSLSSHWLLMAAAGFLLGIIFFSGSLYWLALGGPRWLGPVTPLGGLMFILGWCALTVAAFKVK